MIKKIIKYYSKKKHIICPDIYIGKGTVALLFFITLLFALAIWWLNHDLSLVDFWKDLPVDHKIIELFCEKTEMKKVVRQPVNTFSGIIYLIVAIIILKESQKELKNSSAEKQNKENLIHKIFFAFILLYVFLACTFYHSSLTNFAFKIDFSAVYFFSLFPITYLSYLWLLTNNPKLSDISKKSVIIAIYSVYLIVCLLLSFFVPKGKEHIVSFVCILMFFAFAITILLKNPKKENVNYLVSSIICTIVALVWLKLDKHTFMCNPNSYFQPHSLWNLFIGLSGFYFYVFMRNEDNPKKYLT